MTSPIGDQPDLELGSSGEPVVLLQARLYGLRLFHDVPDGTYSNSTEQAVRDFQQLIGQSPTGTVTRETWDAIPDTEQFYGVIYQYPSPYDARDQIQYDREHGVHRDGAGNVVQPDQYAGQLSEDGQYRWDGVEWQPVNAADGHAGQLSDDGQYRWDGTDWRPVDSGGGTDGYAGQLSADGEYRWDGTNWQSVHAAGSDYVGQLSEDGQWRWDGHQWQAA